MTRSVCDLRFYRNANVFRFLSRILSLHVSRVGVICLISVVSPRQFNGHIFICRSSKAINGMRGSVVLFTIWFCFLIVCRCLRYVKSGACINRTCIRFSITTLTSSRAFSTNVWFNRIGKFKRVIINARFRSRCFVIRKIFNQCSGCIFPFARLFRLLRRIRPVTIERRGIRRSAIMVMILCLTWSQLRIYNDFRCVTFFFRQALSRFPR